MLALFASISSSHVGARPVRPVVARRAVRARAPLLVETENKPAFAFFQRNVPEDQQPVAELQNLRSQAFYDWADSNEAYTEKLRGLYLGTMLFLSLPIASQTFNVLPFELPQLFLSANLGTLAVMLPFVIRLRVGWGFVSKRLLEKASYYEAESRGLLARKDRTTQTRDRLIQKREVAPNLRRIDVSIAAIIVGLFISTLSAEVITLVEGEAGPSTLKTLTGDAAIDYTNRLRGDDEFAAREQARARRKADENGEGLKPAYCDSRYYKILAGGNGQGGVGCD
tara:strand:- start:214 stop:1059 length:846 start_codon:yes stop_codon:yes gene_type:complete